MLRVAEIFKSVQGEGINIGRVCTFVRLHGCNLDCEFCDTRLEGWLPEELTVEEVIARCKTNLVVITGGEPGVQGCELNHLVAALLNQRRSVAIETNGTLPIPTGVHITCSPKSGTKVALNPQHVTEYKYVVTPEFTRGDIIPETLKSHAGRIWLQPEGSDMAAMWQKCYKIALDDPRLRVGLQLHKLMEVQ